MPLTWNYINRFSQKGIVNYTLRISDSQELYKDIYIPVVLSLKEDTKENLNKIAENMVNQYIFENTKPEPIQVTEEVTDVVAEEVTTETTQPETLI
jgi:hypothetical protein